jgi:hypothetical protein
MEKVAQNNTKKKVLFLITKSNWGEKVSKHFRKTRPASLRILAANWRTSGQRRYDGASRPLTNAQVS